MMGPKKLGAIRQELTSALAETGDDPIEWLENRIVAAERRGLVRPGSADVLRSLKRFIEKPPIRPKRRTVGTKRQLLDPRSSQIARRGGSSR